MLVFVSILARELGGDFHPPFLFFLDLDVNNKLFVKVAGVESRVVGYDVVHCIVFPDSFLAVRAVDRDVRAW